jgi:cytochrome b involved in lipid metabolism
MMMTKKATVLVRINGVIYDFANFAERHPGGEQVVEQFHLRDASIPFENHHRKDDNARKMLKSYVCKDSTLIRKAKDEIPPMAPVDKALLELNRKHGNQTLPQIQVWRCLLQPVLELLAGLAFILCGTTGIQYWIGFFLIALAANEGLGLGHEFHHQTMFASGKTNRLAAAWHGLLVYGLHGGCVWREHGGHHAHTNIADADPALNVPIIRWRKEQKSKPLGEDNPLLFRLNRSCVIAGGVLISPIAAWFSGFGYQPIFPWYANIKDDRMVTKWTMIAMVVRLIFMTYLVGPLAAIIAPWAGMVVSSFTASINHFDQPVVMPSEVRQRQWTFTRIQLEGEYGFEEPEFPLAGIIPEFTMGISSEHHYHHFIPNVHHYTLTKAASKVDSFLRRFHLEIKQRTMGEATCASYSTYYKMPNPSSTNKMIDTSTSEGGSGYGLLSGNDEMFEKLRSKKTDFLRDIPDSLASTTAKLTQNRVEGAGTREGGKASPTIHCKRDQLLCNFRRSSFIKKFVRLGL